MTPQQRADVAIELEQEITEIIRAKSLRINGTMMNRIATVAELLSELAVKKELVETR